jgi:hypothetical protein
MLKLNRLVVLSLLWGSLATAQTLDPYKDIRYCGSPVRLADGSIKRSSSVLNAFRKVHPCPSTGLTTGACPGWAMDHVIPLACGGCDAVYNLQWLPEAIKNTSAKYSKDRWERLIYERTEIYDGPLCQSKVVTP